MKRILFLLFAIGLGAGMTVMAGMSTSKIRKETRFLTDKMAYELNLTTQQYNDAYEIIRSVISWITWHVVMNGRWMTIMKRWTSVMTIFVGY